MKALFEIIYKLFKKGIAVLLLTSLLVLFYAFHILFFVIRLFAVPFALIGTVMTVVDGYLDGFTTQSISDLLFLWAIAIVRFILPLLNPVVQHWKSELKGYIRAPLYVRPPVRYTI